MMMEQVDCHQGQKVMHTDWWKEKKLGEQKTGNQTESLNRAVPFLKIHFLGGIGKKRFQSLNCFVLLVFRDRGKNCVLLIKNSIAERHCIISVSLSMPMSEFSIKPRMLSQCLVWYKKFVRDSLDDCLGRSMINR